jgi:hypothetical protein
VTRLGAVSLSVTGAVFLTACLLEPDVMRGVVLGSLAVFALVRFVLWPVARWLARSPMFDPDVVPDERALLRAAKEMGR